MNRFSSFSSTDSDDRRRARRKRNWTILGIVLVLVVLLIAALAILLPRKNSSKNPPGCAVIRSNAQRFDCHPDRPISESECHRRGCCYTPASDLDVTDSDLISSGYLGVPSCFYPQGYIGYELMNASWLGNLVYADLQRNDKQPSGFGDADRIRVEVTHIDDYRLRITIKDPDADPYIPDVPVLDLKDQTDQQERQKKNYRVDILGNSTLTVTRNESQETVVFQASLNRLVYSKQFLQLSTDIASKHIYGLGEQKEGIHRSTNWARYTIWNQGDLPVPHRNLYGSHPFYLVMEPDGRANGLFLLNTNAIDYILQPTPAVTIRAVGGIFDFVLLLGPSPAEVVSQYTSLFGRPNFPPRWSLGFQLCKYGYFSLDSTRETLERNVKAGIPVDVQWHDIDYMENHLDFTYDHENFTGLPDFVKQLHSDGRHYVAMISPGVSNSEKPGTYAAYDVAKELDLFIKDADGNDIEGKVWNKEWTVFPDFSNPKTAGYWHDRFEDFHKELDFDGVWLDMNEPLNFKNGSNKGCPHTPLDYPPYVPGRPYPLNTLTLCMSAKHHKAPHYHEHNLLAYRESKATHETMSKLTGKRPFIIARATYSGQFLYSGHWSGDITSNWADLKYTIPAMLSFSLYGMAMTGSDICGFRQNTTKELCTRWQTLGAFYPMSRNHNDFDTIEQDPAAMGPEVVNATKKALSKRYYLLPYLYTLFYRNHAFGDTVTRPLFFEFSKDSNTYTIEDEFMWGPALLILPALEPGIKEINPYIPAGKWYDFDTFVSRFSKGERVKLDAPLDNINLAIRSGYILPAQVPGNTTTDSARNPFHLLVALDTDGNATGELFWDDGESIDTYENEKYNLIEFSAEKGVIKVSPQKKGYQEAKMPLESVFVFSITDKVNKVTINGEEKADFTVKGNLLTISLTSHTLLEDLKIEWSKE